MNQIVIMPACARVAHTIESSPPSKDVYNVVLSCDSTLRLDGDDDNYCSSKSHWNARGSRCGIAEDKRH